MRKLKLQVDELKVESLVMEARNGRRGTVNGRAEALPTAEDGCQSGGGGGDELASFDYPCVTLFMLDPNCANFTGVLACTIPTEVTCPEDCS